MKKNELPTLGYACGLGAGNIDCRLGPLAIKDSEFSNDLKLQLHWLDWIENATVKRKLAALPIIAELGRRLAAQTHTLTRQKQRFLVVGGDHTSAIGTWGGVAQALAPQSKLGLMWIDAHLDSHTPESSLSGNAHGMPVAALLGKVEALLNSPYPAIYPENLCFLAARSFEAAEKELLERLNVRIYYMEEIQQRGLKTVFQEGLALIKKNTAFYGLSIDLDAIDPKDAPGVGTPEANGIPAQELIEIVKTVNADQKFIGAEIVEFNPILDSDKKTEKVTYQLISSLFQQHE